MNEVEKLDRARRQMLLLLLGTFIIWQLPALALTANFAVGKAIKAYERGTLESMSAWEPLIWPFLTGIAIGLASFALQVLIEAVRHLIGLWRPDAVPGPSGREQTAA